MSAWFSTEVYKIIGTPAATFVADRKIHYISATDEKEAKKARLLSAFVQKY